MSDRLLLTVLSRGSTARLKSSSKFAKMSSPLTYAFYGFDELVHVGIDLGQGRVPDGERIFAVSGSWPGRRRPAVRAGSPRLPRPVRSRCRRWTGRRCSGQWTRRSGRTRRQSLRVVRRWRRLASSRSPLFRLACAVVASPASLGLLRRVLRDHREHLLDQPGQVLRQRTHVRPRLRRLLVRIGLLLGRGGLEAGSGAA